MMRWTGVVLLLPLLAMTAPQDKILDDFESLAGWKTTPSDGVTLELKQDSGVHGKSMRLDFDFHGHGGYAVIHKDIKLAVTGNYEFSFYIRGDAPVNTLEFKLMDSSGDNVWWSNQPDFVFPKSWTRVVRKKRNITFAWGPAGGGELNQIAAIEIAITAGTGGKGSVWLDDLRLTPLEPDGPYTLAPRVTASTALPDNRPEFALDGRGVTAWRFNSKDVKTAVLDIDFKTRREFGGLVLDWEGASRPASYGVFTSIDGVSYTNVGAVGPSWRMRDYLYLPESDARYVRLMLNTSNDTSPSGIVGLSEISVKPLSWSASMNDLLTAIARDEPAGSYPRYFANKQSYWTVVGVNGDTREGLLDTRGMMETGKAQFSVEPFLQRREGLAVGTQSVVTTWVDVTATSSLAEDDLPIPSVHWSGTPLELTVTAYAVGAPGKSILFGRYRVRNSTHKTQSATLHLALRPFQVNPPWQFLNTPGGFARIDSISYDGRRVKVNGDRALLPITPLSSFGALAFETADLVHAIRRALPLPQAATDRLGLASGVLSYKLRIAATADTVIYIAVPLHESDPSCVRNGSPVACTPAWASAQLDSAKGQWKSDLGGVRIQLPKSAKRISESVRANLGYILINRDGPAIQPGSRSYERSWIRDGALTSTALLRLGHSTEVREFLEWYARFQFDNGKIPCCVDARGSDPVPENDSHGEFIYLVAEYFRHTSDTATVNRMWPHVAKAFEFMDSLRLSRTTPEFRTGEKRVFYGLLPQSISHEGYSAKPMHSYWDDFFGLRGFKDLVVLARALNRPEVARYSAARDSFQSDLHRSIALAMANHKIDYVPGAAELGDFDATSTTVGVDPTGELGTALEPAIRRTFDRYYVNFLKRRDDGKPWEIYTPYEWRIAGTLVRLGQRDRAHELVDFFFQGQRPKAWHQWAEVVWERDDTARFIGDMPHTWVGSDFIRSTLDMFAYERDTDSSLVVAAGVPENWLREDNGIRITDLSTHYGRLTYSMRARGKNLRIDIARGVRIPRGGIVIDPPFKSRPKGVLVNGVSVPNGDVIRVTRLPATLWVRY